MLDQIKAYWQLATGLVLIMLIAFGAYSIHHHGYVEGKSEVQAQFDQYKADVKKMQEEQAQKARDEESKQALINQQKDKDYAKVKSDRDRALAQLGRIGLCSVEVVPRGTSVPVAEGGSNPVSSKATSTSGLDDTIALAKGFDFASAVRDRDQCIALQEWVRAQGM